MAPVFLTAMCTWPAFSEVLSAFTNISRSVALTSALSAAASWPGVAAGAGAGALTFGAPVVCRMPAAPLTMSPKAWVTKGKVPSWSRVNSTQPPCDGAKLTVCESWPTTPSTYVRSNTVPMTWKALHLLGPASRTYMRIRSPRRTVIGLALYWLA
jgi:hypothetical protein